LLEQGIIGLLLWIAFIVWYFFNRVTFFKDDWLTGRRMAWYLCLLIFLIGAIGIGTLSSVPNSFLFLVFLGWTSVRPLSAPALAQSPMRPAAVPLGARAY
jgi:hypothetical protein